MSARAMASNRNLDGGPAYPVAHDGPPGGAHVGDTALRAGRRASLRHADAAAPGDGRDRHRLPRADRRRAGRRQDHARRGSCQPARADVPAGAVHAGPHADRHHRHVDPRSPIERVRVPCGADLHPGPAGGRDQSRHAEDPGGAAGGHAGAPGDGGRREPRAPRTVLRARHAEPGGAGGHVPAPRGAARPLPPSGSDRIPGRGAGGADPHRIHGRIASCRPSRCRAFRRSGICRIWWGAWRSSTRSAGTSSRSLERPATTPSSPWARVPGRSNRWATRRGRGRSWTAGTTSCPTT